MVGTKTAVDVGIRGVTMTIVDEVSLVLGRAVSAPLGIIGGLLFPTSMGNSDAPRPEMGEIIFHGADPDLLDEYYRLRNSDPARARAILAEANRRAIESGAAVVNRLLIESAKQGKHILGHRGYIPGRSPFTHGDPQALLDRFSGKGQPRGKVLRGLPGFKERVDFGEVIGEIDGQPTTNGIIHYSKKGAHIVPSNP